MSGRDPPLFAGSILGVREWTGTVPLPSNRARLGALSAKATWATGGVWTEAACKPLTGVRGRHRSPDPACRCGLYALHPTQQTIEGLWHSHQVRQLEGAWGVVEAAGRIEVHRDGFRAERARPLVLVAARSWSQFALDNLEALAELYGARLLLGDEPADVARWCRERGGMLDESQLDELLEDVEAEAGVPVPRVLPQAPAVPVSRWRRAISATGAALGAVVVGTLALAWYGMWASFGVFILGSALFGWFETEVEPPPARILAVKVDRERCQVLARLDSDRDFAQLNLLVSGHLRNGDTLGQRNFKVGPITEGRSELLVAHPPARLCRSRHHFTVRVQPWWEVRNGKRAEVESRYMPKRETAAGL